MLFVHQKLLLFWHTVLKIRNRNPANNFLQTLNALLMGQSRGQWADPFSSSQKGYDIHLTTLLTTYLWEHKSRTCSTLNIEATNSEGFLWFLSFHTRTRFRVGTGLLKNISNFCNTDYLNLNVAEGEMVMKLRGYVKCDQLHCQLHYWQHMKVLMKLCVYNLKIIN